MRWRTIADLTVAPGYPSISVLMPTTLAPRMLDPDRHLMTALVGQSESELDSHELPARGRLMTDLRDLAHQVADEPAESGRALCVSLAIRRSFGPFSPSASPPPRSSNPQLGRRTGQQDTAGHGR